MTLRTALPTAFVLLVAAFSGLAEAATTPAPKTPAKGAVAAPLSAKLTQCSATDALGHFAVFTASMPAATAASPAARMAMRFELQQRSDGRDWLPVTGVPSFGTWERSEPGRPGFIVTKRVNGLQVGGAYRAVVRYRWLEGPNSKVVRIAQRQTAKCVQADTRADLFPAPDPSIVRGTRADLVVYTLTVRNKGKGGAVGSGVVLEVNGTQQPAQRIDPLGPGDRKSTRLNSSHERLSRMPSSA